MAKKRYPRVIISMSTTNALLLTLTTSTVAGAVAGAVEPRKVPLEPRPTSQRQEDSEKVLIKSAGLALTFTVAGKAGRHCGVAYRTSRMAPDIWQQAPGEKQVIDESGQTSLTVSMAGLVESDVWLKVVTAADARFDLSDETLRATPVFVVRMTGRKLETAGALLGDTRSGMAASFASTALRVRR